MYRKYFTLAILAAELSGCATPYVVEAVKQSDAMLTCSQISEEMRQAERFRKEAQNEKGMTGKNVAAVVLFWPAMIGTYSNANEAIAAANLRKVSLMGFFNQKKCVEEPIGAHAPLPDHARIDDILAVPLIKQSGRDAYRIFLTKGYPRAFVVASDSSWSYAFGIRPTDTTLPTDPSERALEMCKRGGHNGCRIYAVDDKVIWSGQ